MGPVRQNPIQRTVSLFICVCIALCTIVAHNIAQNRPDNFPSYPPDNQHCSDDVYLREGGPRPYTVEINNKDIRDVSITTLSTSNNTQHRANAKFTTKLTSAWQANVYNLGSSTSTEISHRVKTDNNVNAKSNQNNLFQNSIALQQRITDE